MRITIEHREESGGLTGSTKHYYVDCTVEFSEEEKAIIKARGLQKECMLFDAAEPMPDDASMIGVVAMRGIGPLMIVGGIGHLIYSAASGSGSVFGLIVLWLGATLAIYGWVAGRKVSKQIDTRVQELTVGQLLSRNRFSVYAPNPAAAQLVNDDIRGQLVEIKNLIAESADIRTKQTFEL